MNKIDHFFIKSNEYNDNKNNKKKYTRSFTFTSGDAGENHVGMQILGKKHISGLNNKDMTEIAQTLTKMNIKHEIIHLKPLLNQELRKQLHEEKEASLIVIRNLLSKEEADNIFEEQSGIDWDNWYYDIRRSKVLNKRRRHNLLYDEVGQKSDHHKKGTVIAWSDAPLLKKGVDKLTHLVGEMADSLITEGNDYYDIHKKGIGIGYHGDTERNKVFALKIGATMELRYRWHYRHSIVSDESVITLNHGDAYIMSEKAVGSDWKKSSIPTLRHCSVPPGVKE